MYGAALSPVRNVMRSWEAILRDSESTSMDTTRPSLPRAARVSAKKSAEPPCRVPVSITCSIAYSKMISW